MAFCPKCGYQHGDDALFCQNCGSAVAQKVPVKQAIQTDEAPREESANVDSAQPAEIPGVPLDDTFTVTTPVELVERSVISPEDSAYPKKKKKKRKKKIILFSILGVVIVLIVLAIIFVAPYAPHYLDGNAALERGDYEKAISCYKKADGFLDSEEKTKQAHYKRAGELFEDEKYYDAAYHYSEVIKYKDSADMVLKCGELLAKNGEYSVAGEIFDLLDSQQAEEARNYSDGMILFEATDYEGARGKFLLAGEYSNALEMSDACYLMQADACAKSGDFEKALRYYKMIPEDFTYGGISVSERVGTIENSYAVINLVGTWKPTSSHSRSSNGAMYWYHEQILSTESMTIECKMDEYGALLLSGTVYYPLLPEYESISDSSVPEICSETFTLNNVTDVPLKITLSNGSTLTYSEGTYKFYYFDKNDFGHTRIVDIVFAKEDETL